jgi:gluconate 2-dehydrogenase alpha chain
LVSTVEPDVIVVGLGWVGGIIAAELTKAGLSVVGLERGPDHDGRAGAFAGSRDELRIRRLEHTQATDAETWTLRHDRNETALPFRRAGAFTPGTGVGGSSLLYGGMAWRFPEYDFAPRTAITARYGAGAIPDGATIADWGLRYQDLAPYYDQFERMAGVGGRAGNINGEIQPGGNPFEAPRFSDFPVPPLRDLGGPSLFRDTVQRLGYHPFPVPSSALSTDYVNPDGIARRACTYCGYCAGAPCEFGAKADAVVTVLPVARRTGRFEVRADCTVTEVLHDGGTARGVRYYDAAGTRHELRARAVVLSAYAFNNTRLLLNSGLGTPYDPVTGTGAVGKNYGYNFGLHSHALFANRRFQNYVGSPAIGYAIAEYNADNFDHTGLGFLDGGLIWTSNRAAGPLAGIPVPPGTPRWGPEWKRAIGRWYDRFVTVVGHGAVLPHRDHYLDLDPTYTDRYGLPLLRITFDWGENDRRMYAFMAGKVASIVAAMDPDEVVPPAGLPEHFNSAVYQSTHNTGGAIMGPDPAASVVSPWLRMWDCGNVWVAGGSALPQGTGTGPTGTICALAYRAAHDIIRSWAPGRSQMMPAPPST